MKKENINIKIKRVLGDNAKKIIIKILFPFRNKFVLFNIRNKARKNQVNINYWGEAPNLGDSISPVIVRYMLEKKGINENQLVSETRHLYAVGSVLTAGIQDCTVWGSGILNADISYRVKNRKLDIRAVRGPLTRLLLQDYGYSVPSVYGDPAIIFPEIYSPKKIKKMYSIGLVVHKDYKIEKSISNKDLLKHIKIINIKTDNYEVFIDEICSCKKIISSSLHGIILSEVYGVPAVLLKPQVDLFKYYDYYYSTKRYEFPIAENLDDAINISPISLPDLKEMRLNLKKVFPYDIYLR